MPYLKLVFEEKDDVDLRYFVCLDVCESDFSVETVVHAVFVEIEHLCGDHRREGLRDPSNLEVEPRNRAVGLGLFALFDPEHNLRGVIHLWLLVVDRFTEPEV